MGFELRKKGKFKEANKFVERMQEIQGEAKAALSKAQEDMKKYADRYRGEVEEYRVGDLVLLSTKDLKYQMVGRRTEKLTERFGTLQGQVDSFNECHRIRTTEYSKNSSGS